MKPFDLEKALAGEPVVTRSGLAVTEIQFFQDVSNGQGLIAVAGGVLRRYNAEGVHYYSPVGEDPHDLFMAPVKKQGWVNLYSPKIQGFPDCMADCQNVWETREAALEAALAGVIATVMVEWEE